AARVLRAVPSRAERERDSGVGSAAHALLPATRTGDALPVAQRLGALQGRETRLTSLRLLFQLAQRRGLRLPGLVSAAGRGHLAPALVPRLRRVPRRNGRTPEQARQTRG